MTGWEKSLAFWLIAEWLSLLPSTAWLKLYPRAFSWANPSLRSAWQQDLNVLFQVSFSKRSLSLLDCLDGVGLAWRSYWILSSVGWAWILPYWSAKLNRSSLDELIEYSAQLVELYYASLWVHNSQRRLFLIQPLQSNTVPNTISSLDRACLTW